MGKKVFTPQGELKEAAEKGDFRAKKAVLASGFILTLASFVMVLASLLMVFVPSFVPTGGASALQINTVMFSVAIGASFIGVVMAASSAAASPLFARFSLFFGVCSFIAGSAMLLICLFAKTVLPLDFLSGLSSAK